MGLATVGVEGVMLNGDTTPQTLEIAFDPAANSVTLRKDGVEVFPARPPGDVPGEPADAEVGRHADLARGRCLRGVHSRRPEAGESSRQQGCTDDLHGWCAAHRQNGRPLMQFKPDQSFLQLGIWGNPIGEIWGTHYDMMKTLAGLPILFDPGDKFEYGMSTDVLGRVVEVTSGMTLDRFFEDKILKPLGMNDTMFRVPPEKRNRLVAVYIPADGGIRKLEGGKIGPGNVTSDYPYSESHRYLAGGGGLCSTASDYMRFCQMLLNGGQSMAFGFWKRKPSR